MDGFIVGIIGLGFVGGAIKASFQKKHISLKVYDKYKGIGAFEQCLESELLFLCLPTQFGEDLNRYDKQAIYDTCQKLHINNYTGLVIVKSTVEPGTTQSLSHKYPSLKLIHNPEFLTARTAEQDFHNQRHIVLGQGSHCPDASLHHLRDFYNYHYPEAEISLCTASESESMKLFANCFYAVKIQFFNEAHQLCQKTGADYDLVVDMMVKNGWVNPMHTQVPGTDGKLSYGGLCFPKDTRALLSQLRKEKLPHAVVQAAVEERNQMRTDHSNVVDATTTTTGN